MDGDGFSDLLVTSPPDRVSVYSGASVTLLYDLFGAATFPEVESIGGDVDGDGCDDFAVGWYLSDRVGIHSGATGDVITYLLGNAWSGGPSSFLGRGLAKAGDLNGDGVPDLFVGGPESECDPCGNAEGFVRAYDGATWEVIWETGGGNGNIFNPTGSTLSEFGWQMEGGGDINGDGVNDLFALHNGGQEHAEFLSGATGATLYRLRKLNLPGALDLVADIGDCDIIGDLDGDGYDEFAVVDRSESFFGGLFGGRVFIMRGSPGDIAPICPGTPASTGTTPDLFVFGPITEGGREMELRLRDGVPGSLLTLLTGLTGPSIPVGSGELCLNPSTTARLGAPLGVDSDGLAAMFVPWFTRPVSSTWAAGTTWTVQGLYTDPGDPVGVNTTTALEITFTR